LNNVVSLARTKSFDEEGIRQAVYDAIDMVGLDLPAQLCSVFIKPNLCYYWDYSTGETTDPRVVSAVIDYLRDRCGNDLDIRIVESDASAMRVKHAFKMLGYERLSNSKSVGLMNLCEDKVVEKLTEVKGHQVRLPLPSSVFEVDLMINVPKLKTGPFASGKGLHITCALKNLFGCIATNQKVHYHPDINEVIVAVNKLIETDLTVVDGIIAKGKNPCKLGLVMAGKEEIFIDYVVSQIMGYDPLSVEHLSLAIEEGIANLNGMNVIGERVEEFSKRFQRVNNFIFRWSWKSELLLLKLYTKVAGDIIPPAIE